MSGRAIVLVMVSACLPLTAWAQTWGDLELRFVYGGELPVRRPIAVDKDWAFCGPQPLLDESLLVHSQDRGVANVLVWLVSDRDVPVHESHRERPPVTIEARGCRIVPRLAVVQVGQTLNWTSADAVGHNVQGDFPRNACDLTGGLIAANRGFSRVFKTHESAPALIDCSIHPWMTGYVLVHDNPYSGTSDEHGRLLLRNVPVGRWTCRVWHERAGFFEEARQQDRRLVWPRGNMAIEIKPDANDLGEITLLPASFQKRQMP